MRAFISALLFKRDAACDASTHIRAERANERTIVNDSRRRRIARPSDRTLIFHAPAAIRRPFSRPVNLSWRSRQSSVSGRLNIISASGHNGPLFSRYHSGVSVLSSLAPAALPPVHLLPVSLRVSLSFSPPFVPENHYLTIDRMCIARSSRTQIACRDARVPRETMGPREHSLAPILSKLSSGSAPLTRDGETDVGIYSDGFFFPSFFSLCFFFFDISKRWKIKDEGLLSQLLRASDVQD